MNYRYFKLSSKANNGFSIWVTNTEKTSEKMIYSSTSPSQPSVWHNWVDYRTPKEYELEVELTEDDAFLEMI
jgi:hypothetical protein